MIRGFVPTLLCLVLVCGCQDGNPEFLPVGGKVTYNGVTVQGGLIVFTPDPAHGGHGEIATAEIRDDGTYSLRTGKCFGAAAGWYRVTVASLGAQGVLSPGQRYQVPSSLLPEKYRDPQLSRLVCEVKAERANSVDFNLD